LVSAKDNVTQCPQKTKLDNFFKHIILFRTHEIFFIKFGGLSPESMHDTTAVAFPTKPV